ncbi:MAG: hypothetical protein Aurels2KO_03840 [Aureliella sp.]
MYRNTRTRLLVLAAILATVGARSVEADIITFRDGQDLVVDFRQSIDFTVNRAHSSSTLGIAIHDLFSADVAGSAEVEPIAGDTALRISRVPVDAVSASYGAWGQINFTFGEANPRGMYGLFNFAQQHSLKIGTRVTLDAGSIRLPDYFDNPNAVLPDRKPTGVVLTDATQVALSSVAAVPEPSSAAAVLVGCMALLRTRRSAIFG